MTSPTVQILTSEPSRSDRPAGAAPLKVLHFSQADIFGGAAKTAYRLHRALLNSGAESRMAVLHKGSQDPTVIRAIGETMVAKARFHGARLLNARIDRHFHTNFGFSADLLGVPEVGWLPLVGWADVINLHFVNGFLIPSRLFRAARQAGVPVVWTLQDFAPVTGGCHYPADCLGWQQTCGACPVIGSKRDGDFSRFGWKRRSRAYGHHSTSFVAQSSWCGERLARASLCQDNEVIYIPFVGDTLIFRPLDRQVARAALGLPEKGLFILCLAADFEDPRKGFRQFLDILKGLWAKLEPGGRIRGEEVQLLTVGHVDIAAKYDLPWKSYHLGFLPDDRLTALAYQASNLFLSTTVEDIGPQTPVESMLCGTPVVSFSVGTARDLIEHRKTGFIVPMTDAAPYIETAYSALLEYDLDEMGILARHETVRQHGPETIAAQYNDLYRRLIKRPM